jgi:hypothetical protein
MFVGELLATLVPQLRPKYVVEAERRVYVEHDPEDELRYIQPDVAMAAGDANETTSGAATAAIVEPVVLTVPVPVEHREAFLCIRLRETREVVAVIEILSPANKRPGSDGRSEYLRKRDDVLESKTHLVELDLLRGGERLPTVQPLPAGDYFAFVCRGNRRPRVEVYAWGLRGPLPLIPVPLVNPDPDATLDLQAIFISVYDRAGYDYSLDYNAPLDPPLSEPDEAWAKKLLGG